MQFYNTTNRIDDAITRQRDRISKLEQTGSDLQGNPIKPSLERMDKVMELTFLEHYKFQSLKSKAQSMNRINTDETVTIHNALGMEHNPDNGGWQNGVDLATKIIITQFAEEELKFNIRR
jgi:hypothetical protein